MEPGFISSPFVQLVGVFITALSGYLIAKFNRSGAKEANQTTGWISLVTALQKEVEELRKEEDATKAHIKDLDQGNRDLARRVYVLERSRHRWKGWGQQVVEIMKARGIEFPTTPEPLDDTDPNIPKDRS
jgi:FtsZ-binding cell division protein ZapB